MPKISLSIHTVSPDNFLANQGIPSYLTALVDCLERQTFKDFELIYVDYYQRENNPLLDINPSFTIKHVQVDKNHRYWYDKGNYHISAAKNTGLLHADGELFITCDDAEFFPENFLAEYWRYYKDEGKYAHAAHKRFNSLQVSNGCPIYPLQGDENTLPQHIDTRRFNSDKHYHSHGTWMFAGSSCSLEHALRLNGFNERLDGYKSLEDCDFGIRMALTGGQFVIDRNLWLGILMHQSYADSPTKPFNEFIAVENYGTLRWAQDLNEIVANKNPIEDKHLKIVQRETLKYRHFDCLGGPNGDKMAVWKATPTFDLTEERKILRASPDWKW
jgi:glycosyltransferase involved in cell wall biosynthesis